MREDLDTLNDDATQVQSKMMYIEQEYVSFDEIGFDLVLVHEKGHEAPITQNLDPPPSIEPWPPPVCSCEYVEHVIGTVHTNDQHENLISNDPLDDTLEDFLTSCGPLDTSVASKGVNEWIDFYIEKDLNEWEIHLDNFLRLDPKMCCIVPINIPNDLGGHVSCIISSDLEPDISWGEMHCSEDIHIVLTVKLFHWDDPQKFRLLIYDKFID